MIGERKLRNLFKICSEDEKINEETVHKISSYAHNKSNKRQ